MLAVLLLNRMTMKRRMARKQRLSKPTKPEAKVPEVVYCRTCLGTEDLETLFASKAQEKKRSHELKLATGLEIKMDDGLSQKICNKCIDVIKISILFRRTSKKAEKTLIGMSGMAAKKKLRKKVKKIPKNKLNELKEEVEIECEFDMGNDFQNDDYVDDNDYQNDDVDNEQFNNDVYQNDTCHNDAFDDAVNFDPSKEEGIDEQSKNKTTGKKKRQMTIQNVPPYKCNTCSKEFRMKATYKAHMRFHTNYCVCETCGKRCRNNNQLQEHKRARHGLGRIHKCAYCEYSSATKEALTIHERRHTGERPYVCDHCGATFHRRSNLVQHIAIHLPEKNFQCDMCPKRLKSRKFLQIHKHNAHTGRRYGYLCAVCDHRFEKPNKVRAHTRRVHGVPDDQQGPICTICNKREKSKKLLKVHEYKAHRAKKYKYICPVCGGVFSRPGNARHHLTRSHHVPRHVQAPIERLEIHASVLPENILMNQPVVGFNNIL